MYVKKGRDLANGFLGRQGATLAFGSIIWFLYTILDMVGCAVVACACVSVRESWGDGLKN